MDAEDYELDAEDNEALLDYLKKIREGAEGADDEEDSDPTPSVFQQEMVEDMQGIRKFNYTQKQIRFDLLCLIIIEYCDVPNPPANSHYITTQRSAGALVAYYECRNDDYVLVGPLRRTCRIIDGAPVWSEDVPECKSKYLLYYSTMHDQHRVSTGSCLGLCT